MLGQVEFCVVLVNDNESIVLEHDVSFHTFCLLADGLEPQHAKMTEEQDDDWDEGDIPDYGVLTLSTEQTHHFSVSSTCTSGPQTSMCNCTFFLSILVMSSVI